MPTITVPQETVRPAGIITDTRRLIPPGIFDRQFAAGQGLARSIGQLAQPLSEAAALTLRAQGEEEFANANIGYATAFRDFQAERSTDTDYAGYTKKFDDWHKAASTELINQINHSGAKTRAQQKFDLLLATNGKTIDTFAQNALVKQVQTDIPNKIEGFIDAMLQADTREDSSQPEPPGLILANAERKAYFDMLVETGAISPERAETLEAEFQGSLGFRLLQNEVRAIAAEDPRGWDAAEDWLTDPKNAKEIFEEFKITLADQGRIVNLVQDWAAAERADGKVELDRLRTEQGNDFVKKLEDMTQGKQTEESFNDLRGEILASDLLPTGENSKSSWLQKVTVAVEAINKDKDNPFLQTDQELFRELQIKIEADPSSVTINQLNEAWGKGIKGGLNRADRNTLEGMITNPDDPLNDQVAIDGRATLDRFRQKEIFSSDDKENITLGLDFQIDYDTWIRDFVKTNNRKPTGEESSNQIKFMMTDVALGLWPWTGREELRRDIEKEVAQLPPDGKRAFVRSIDEERDTDEWIKEFRAEIKPLTFEIALHYRDIAGGNIERAKELAERDGYR